jgi:hypothetical protein
MRGTHDKKMQFAKPTLAIMWLEQRNFKPAVLDINKGVAGWDRIWYNAENDAYAYLDWNESYALLEVMYPGDEDYNYFKNMYAETSRELNKSDTRARMEHFSIDDIVDLIGETPYDLPTDEQLEEAKTKMGAHGGGHEYDELESDKEFTSGEGHVSKDEPGAVGEFTTDPGEGAKLDKPPATPTDHLEKVKVRTESKIEVVGESFDGRGSALDLNLVDKVLSESNFVRTGVISIKDPEILSVHGLPSNDDLESLEEALGPQYDKFPKCKTCDRMLILPQMKARGFCSDECEQMAPDLAGIDVGRELADMPREMPTFEGKEKGEEDC